MRLSEVKIKQHYTIKSIELDEAFRIRLERFCIKEGEAIYLERKTLFGRMMVVKSGCGRIALEREVVDAIKV